MAISVVGAGDRSGGSSTTPRLRAQPQIGIQNAIVTALGFDPVAWLRAAAFHLNSLLLMVMLLWAQVGFSMVLLSAAVKGVPTDTLEAGRIDGANERQIFFRIVFPQIKGTIVTVFITVLIGVMKIFDIVYVMTNGNFNTNVLGDGVLQPAVHQLQQRRRVGHRRHADDRGDPGHVLPGASLPAEEANR